MSADERIKAILDAIDLGFIPVDLDTLDLDVRHWADAFAARGYVLVADDAEGWSWVHIETGRYMLGWPETGGVNIALWSDFYNSFHRQDFDSEADYLDAVEARFDELWRHYEPEVLD